MRLFSHKIRRHVQTFTTGLLGRDPLCLTPSRRCGQDRRVFTALRHSVRRLIRLRFQRPGLREFRDLWRDARIDCGAAARVVDHVADFVIRSLDRGECPVHLRWVDSHGLLAFSR